VSEGLVPDSVRRFLFDHIDSVEQLEILLLLWRGRERAFAIDAVFQALRTNAESIRRRIDALVTIGIAQVSTSAPPTYRYVARSGADDEMLAELARAYEVRPHRVLEVLFSSAKRARPFADAFRLVKPRGEDDDG
jgi:hypothetical protein